MVEWWSGSKEDMPALHSCRQVLGLRTMVFLEALGMCNHIWYPDSVNTPTDINIHPLINVLSSQAFPPANH